MGHVTHVQYIAGMRRWGHDSWVMSHVWMRHVTHMNESCHTCEWVMSHMWMSHVTHMKYTAGIRRWGFNRYGKSCHRYEWIMSHIRMSHATHMNELRHTHVTHMQGYNVGVLIDMLSHGLREVCHVTHSSIRDATHSYITWLIHIWHMGRVMGSEMYVTWLTHPFVEMVCSHWGTPPIELAIS